MKERYCEPNLPKSRVLRVFVSGLMPDEIIDELFGASIKEHIVFYRINNNEIFIIRILHKRMDFKNKFK